MSKPEHGPILRPWRDAWQLWLPGKKAAGFVLAEQSFSGERKAAVAVCCAIPARKVLSVPFWVEAADAGTAREIALLEVEMKGYAAGERIAADVDIRILRQCDGRALVLAVIYPGDDALDFPAEKPRRFVPSPMAAVLGGTMVHLWKELDDLVAVVVWHDEIVCWETLPAATAQNEVRSWLECLMLQLTGEIGFDAPFLLKEWHPVFDEPPEIFTREPMLSEEDRRNGPSVRVSLPAFDWLPGSLRRARETGRKQRAVVRAASAVLGLVLAALLAAAALSLQINGRIRDIDRRTEAMEIEIAPLREVAARWNAVEASVDDRFHPLEILRGIVTAMPESGIRLTVFEMSSERVLVEGEADNVRSASAFFQAVEAMPATGLAWEMPPPSLQPNNTARFAITGVQENRDGQ